MCALKPLAAEKTALKARLAPHHIRSLDVVLPRPQHRVLQIFDTLPLLTVGMSLASVLLLLLLPDFQQYPHAFEARHP
jgi:hypothetical protein